MEAGLLSGWHDFFVVMGAASGSLIGAMFVVVSIGSGIVKQSTLASRIFVTPTIIHLAFVLMACAFILVPSITPTVLGMAAGLGGLVFLAYSGRNVFHIHRQGAVLVDHAWYGYSPVLAYVAMIAAGMLILDTKKFAIETLALALALLVVGGIRNAWDLILFFLERHDASAEKGSP